MRAVENLVVVGDGAGRRGGDACRLEEFGKVLLPQRPFIATSVLCGECFSFEAFEDARPAEILIVDTGASSCLAFGGLGFVETGFSGGGSMFAMAMDQFGALVEDLTEALLERALQVALCRFMIDAGKAA